MSVQHRESARAAFQAYNAMETTKRRHFDYLAKLEAARKLKGTEPDASERELLAQLLSDHDAQVQEFSSASAELKAADAEAFAALWRYIGMVNQLLGVGEVNH